MTLLLDAGEPWLIPFERVARIATDETLRSYAFDVDELEGLLFADEGFVPVWRPREFAASGPFVVVYYGVEGLAGLRAAQVSGVREAVGEEFEHGAWVGLADGSQGRWFDIEALERRLEARAVSGGMNA